MQLERGVRWFLHLLDFLERRFGSATAVRPIEDDAFYDTYYGHTGIPREIPIRVRRVFALQLGPRWDFVRPSDVPACEEDDIDFADLAYEVGLAFGIDIPDADVRVLDGSLDSVVRYLAARLPQGRGERE